MSEFGGESRETLLKRVRAALGRERTAAPRVTGALAPGAPAPPIDDALVRTVTPDRPLVELFVERAASVGMRPALVTAGDAPGRLRELLDAFAARRVSVGLSDPQAIEWLGAAARGADGPESAAPITFVEPTPEAGLEPHFDSQVGVSDVRAAVAESGTLVYACDAAHPRGVCLVPPLHIAIVRAGQIVADLLDLAPLAAACGQHTTLLYITGPSKTADIEGVLVTGVHGPREVHVLVVQDA